MSICSIGTRVSTRVGTRVGTRRRRPT